MPETPDPDTQGMDAFARARRTRVVVVGGGFAGLVAALEWAKIGAQVTVLEASDRFGGMVETVLLDGLPVDAVADAFPLGSDAFGALIDDLRLRDLVEPAAPHPAWIAGLPGGGAAPLPAATVLGIPANPWASDVRRIIGWGGAWRAYLDRLRPPLTIGHERSLGRLVRSRMGDRVVDRLVAPVTRGLYAVSPDEIDVEVAAPGLSTALTRTGSLAGAAFDLPPDNDADDEDAGSSAAPTRATLRGGLGVVVAALVERLHDLGADLRTGVPVGGIERDPEHDHEWRVTIAEPATAADDIPPGVAAASPAAPPIVADVVVVATPARAAARLLESAGCAVAAPDETVIDVVTLVAGSPALDAAPRGRAAYPAFADAAVLGVADASVDWPWLAARGGPRHVLRVSLPVDPDGPDRSDDERATDATRAAESLLGVPLGGSLGAPLPSLRRRVVVSPPASLLDHDARVRGVRDAVAQRPGLAVVGAWVSGSGLAQITADTVAAVDRMRSAVLWGAGAPADEGPLAL